MPGEYLHHHHEYSVIDDLDFTDYSDPVVQSIHEWDQSGKQWSGKVRAFFHAATIQGRPEPAGQRLNEATVAYADSFENAAMIVMSDSLVPEKAVEALGRLIRADDANRRVRLRKTEPMIAIPLPSQRYVTELARAYGDPDSLLLPLDNPPELTPTVLARMTFLAHIEDQAQVLIGNLRTAQPDSRPMPGYDVSRDIGRRAFGRYMPSADQ